jgi:3-deoxy-D-manno-octulosonate 8-phosphate phosphatase (KDO 8-P phosphatase)
MKNMSSISGPAVTEIAANIRMLLMDVDGVLTDGKVFGVPDPAGVIVETKGFDTQDGIALQWLSWKGLVTGVISGRVSPATELRAKQCNMTYVYQGHIEKIPRPGGGGRGTRNRSTGRHARGQGDRGWCAAVADDHRGRPR